MLWLWIGNFAALVALLWGARRLLRNRVRRMSGRGARRPVAARIAVAAGLCWIPLYFVLLVLVVRPLQDIRRAQAINELQDIGGLILAMHGHVNLSGTKATDEHVRLVLRYLPNTAELNLSGTRITDAAADDLVLMPRLKEVNLKGTAMSPKAYDRVMKHANLVKLVERDELMLAQKQLKEREEAEKRAKEERELVQKQGCARRSRINIRRRQTRCGIGEGSERAGRAGPVPAI